VAMYWARRLKRVFGNGWFEITIHLPGE
jgi:hypothetical protein